MRLIDDRGIVLVFIYSRMHRTQIFNIKPIITIKINDNPTITPDNGGPNGRRLELFDKKIVPCFLYRKYLKFPVEVPSVSH